MDLESAGSEATPVETEEAILAGIRIVDLGGSIAGMVASMLLAEVGADVVLVEPPTGSPWRSKSGFPIWSRSKRSLACDIETESGRAELAALIEKADVLVHSFGPTRARALGLDQAALAARYPDLIVASVLGWPIDHPDADAPVDDLITLARLGILDEQAGRREGPIFVRVPLGTWPAVWLAAIGIVTRLIARERTGTSGPVNTSLAQGALVPMMMHWYRAETPTEALRIGMPKRDMRASLFECLDGRWIHVMPPSPDETPLMREVLAEMGPSRVAGENAAFAHQPMRGYSNWGANHEAFRRRNADAWLAELWANDIPAQSAAPFGTILSNEQARANDYVLEWDDPAVGRIRAAGLPMMLDPKARMRGPAPAIGEGGDSLRDAWAGRAQTSKRSAARHPHAPARPRFPLEGLKVVDFGTFLAGPLGPMLLADLGAEVIKVESTQGDPMRLNEWPFAGCQRGKRSVALDLKSPETRPVVEALLRWADVVHHNLRRPAARRLGLDAESVRAINPDVVFCHVSSYGPLGPRADWPGYDQLFQAACGWELLGAGEGNPPMWHRFGFMDHLCAMSSALATLLALHRRDRTGRGSDVAASLLGAGVLTNSETYLREDGTLAEFAVLDRDQMGTAPGIRILAASDGWVALATESEDAIQSLCGKLGARGAKALDEVAAKHTCESLLEELRAAGIASTRVRQDQRDPFFDDPAHRTTRLATRYPHAEWGMFEQPGALWNFADLEVRLDRAPPALGEHTVEVLRELGIEMAVIDRLIATGAAKSR